jgi:hypothetical protein
MPANPARTLPSPDNHSLLMVDHQYRQTRTIRTRDGIANTMLTKRPVEF